MVSDEECTTIYAFLVQAMRDEGLSEVVAEVEQEIEDLESVSSADLPPDVSESGTTPSRRRRPNKFLQAQESLPGLHTEAPMPGQLAPDPLMQRERIYTPQRRVLLLIDALAFAVADPVELGEVITRSLGQEKVLFGEEPGDKQAFLLSREEIAGHLDAARQLRRLLGELRQRIEQGEETR